MKMAPAVAAAMPAALVSTVAVMVMSVPRCSVPGGRPAMSGTLGIDLVRAHHHVM
jgi:hypothetical protein